MLLDGVLIAPRGMVAFSTVTTEEEVDRVIEAMGQSLRRLAPALVDEAAVAS